MTTIEELSDRAEIQDALHRYSQAQDQDQWQLYETVFAENAQVQLVGLPLDTLSAQEFGRFLREDFGSTRLSGQHLIGNTLIKIEGDVARSVSEVLHATLQRTDTHDELKLSEGTSLYADSWLRTRNGWRITRRIITQKSLDERVVTYEPEFIATIEAGASHDWFVETAAADNSEEQQ